MKRNEISKNAHKNAVEHGFWDVRKSHEHYLMLICTEVAELVEADRNESYANITGFNSILSKDRYLNYLKGYGYDTPEKAEKYKSYEKWYDQHHQLEFPKYIKDTVQDEFADIYIRLADLAGALDVDFDNTQLYNWCCPLESFSVTENAVVFIKGILQDNISIKMRIRFGIGFLEEWAKQQNVDLEWHIEQKMKYNQYRKQMHGKKY